MRCSRDVGLAQLLCLNVEAFQVLAPVHTVTHRFLLLSGVLVNLVPLFLPESVASSFW